MRDDLINMLTPSFLKGVGKLLKLLCTLSDDTLNFTLYNVSSFHLLMGDLKKIPTMSNFSYFSDIIFLVVILTLE